MTAPRALMAAALVLALHAGARADDQGNFLVERDNVEIAPADAVKLLAIEVDNRIGDVTIEGRDGPGVSLAVIKRAPDAATLERLKVKLVPDPSGVIRVTAAVVLTGEEAQPLPTPLARVDIKLTVPRGVHLDVRAWNGKVSVTGVRGGLSLAANRADFEVTGVEGAVSTANTRGRQQIVDVKGEVSARNTFGDVVLDRVSGDSLEARVSEGGVVATHIRSRQVLITTTFGDILFRGELVAGGSYQISSHKGNVEVLVGGASFRLDAYSRDGTVDPQVELSDVARPEPGRLLGSFGGPGGRPAGLELRSILGDVRLGLVSE